MIDDEKSLSFQEVKEFLGGCGVNNISISKKSRHGKSTLVSSF